MARPAVGQPIELNCLGGNYKMKCTCEVNYTKLSCPVHEPGLYLEQIRTRKGMVYRNGKYHSH